MKKQCTEWEKIFTNHISGKGLVSRTHKELLQFSKQKTDNLILKRAKNFNRNLSKEDIQRAHENMHP